MNCRMPTALRESGTALCEKSKSAREIDLDPNVARALIARSADAFLHQQGKALQTYNHNWDSTKKCGLLLS
jgi:hypothetical protein